MKDLQTVIDELRRLQPELRKRYPIREMGVFGSWVRGEQTEGSDIDVLVDLDDGEWEEQWTGDYVFENEWQSFRTKKDRSLELTSVALECPPGRRTVAVKVVAGFTFQVQHLS